MVNFGFTTEASPWPAFSPTANLLPAGAYPAARPVQYPDPARAAG